MFALLSMNANKINPNTHGDSVSATGSAEIDSALINKPLLARAIFVSTRTIDNLQRRRIIPFVRISARCVRYHLPSVIAALRKLEIREAGR